MSIGKFSIGDRVIGRDYEPLVITELGINHGGDINKAKRMIDDAHQAGAECIKLQCHILEEEMVKNDVIPGHTKNSIWDIIKGCILTEKEELELKDYIEARGMIFLSTPFSFAAADRLQAMGVHCFKIGSGECNNFPLIEYIAKFEKPMIISTGMNDLNSISQTVNIVRKYHIPYALLHCTSIYPTPYSLVRLTCLTQLENTFPDAVIGLSDHALGNYMCFGAIPLGASILEKHFTSTHDWDGPDIALSLLPHELADLIKGTKAIYESLRPSEKTILEEELPTIKFAYASVVAKNTIQKGEILTNKNLTLKRPGMGEFHAKDYNFLLGKIAQQAVQKNEYLTADHITE